VGKAGVKAEERILELIAAYARVTVTELVKEVGLTVRGVEWNIQKLKQRGKLKRVGGRKVGHWEVVG